MIGDQQILGALRAERDFVAKGVGFSVASVRREGANTVFVIEPQRGGRSRSIDESLEGSRVLWGDGEGRGEVVYVNPDEGEIILRFCVGALPAQGDKIRLFQRDFLSPVIDLWEDEGRRKRARQLQTRDGNNTGGIEERPLPAPYDQLRTRQREAVEAGNKRTVLLIGPPGTGKTFTVGAVIARLLSRFKGSCIILAGPTNVAVDGALIEADNWLAKIGREDLRSRLKRVGAWFDPRKYADRQHLLAPGVYDAAARLSALELDEPPRRQVEAYVKWKDAVEAARKELRTNLEEVLRGADVIAATTATLAHWHHTITEAKAWNFVVCDEASQIPFPTAWMTGSMGRRAYFAGDPNQLAPVVQNPAPEVTQVLGKTAFETLPRAARLELDEQSRMCPAICDAVSRTFYDGLLRVCEKTRSNKEWTDSRSPCFINGREVPRVYFEPITDQGRWSAKYGGLIRLESASVVRDLTEELLGSYVSADEILVLTPFRAQRALLRKLFFRGPLRSVRISTVHRSQGSESSVVIFDPVNASSSFLNSPDGRRLINVAVSRAKAHVAIMANEDDLSNPWIKKLQALSRSLWHKTDSYAKPFAINRSPVLRAAG